MLTQPPTMLEALAVERHRKHYLLLLISYFSMAFMLAMGLLHLGGDDTPLKTLLFSGAGALCLNILFYHWSRHLEQAMQVLAGLVTLFLLCLVYEGGFAHTALYWVFPAPPILYGLLGPWAGTFINSLLLSCCAGLMFGPDIGQTMYPEPDRFRFLAALFGLMLACGIKEHFRALSHHNMDLLQRSKEQLANTDALTGLANRRFFNDVLPLHLEQQPERFFPMAIISLDLDHFKHINDSFGHIQGDLVLQQTAQILKQKLRQPDIAIRLGGEEFLLLLPKTSIEAAATVANKLRQQIAQHRFLADQPELVITGSFGVSQVTALSALPDSLQQVDSLLYQAKRQGRNQVCQPADLTV